MSEGTIPFPRGGKPKQDAPPPDVLINREAEQALLGALMMKPQLIEALPTSFDPSHYAYGNHQEIHRAVVEVGKPGVPALLLVTQALALSDVEERAYITGLVNAVVSLRPDGIVPYAELITDMHRRRAIVTLAEKMRLAAFQNPGESTADVTIAKAMSALDAMVMQSGSTHPVTSLNGAMDDAIRAADEAAARDGPAGLSTGWHSVDDALGGLEDGTLTVLGARPGMGKTAASLQIAINVARQGIGVLVISLEMSARELGRRALATASGVSVEAMKKGHHEFHHDKLKAAREELHNLPLSIEDGGGLTAGMIGLKARAAHRRHGVGLIVVDHLHIVRHDDVEAKQGATQAVGAIAIAMKRLAKEHRCPVLLLAQLNRGVEGRDDKRPSMFDLRQSGAIEEAADAVVFLYRAEYYMTKEPEHDLNETAKAYDEKLTKWRAAKADVAGKAELIFAKVRDGAPCTVPMLFHGETTSFSEPTS